MRILKISDVYFPRVNGVSTSIQTFSKEFVEMGHEVTLIAPQYNKTDEQHQNLYRIPSRNIPFDPEDRLLKRSYIRKLSQTLAQQSFDIIHIETPFVAHYEGLRLAKQLNIPTIETYHTHFEEYFYHYMPFLPKAALKFAARQFNRMQCNSVDSIVVPSQAMLDILTQYGVNKPMRILPTGIDKHYFNAGDGAGFREKYGIAKNKQVLLHIGRVAHEKNIDFLLHMLNHLRRSMPDVLLLIAGEGPALNHIKKLASTLSLNDNVMFVGYLDRNTELLDCYAASDVFVFASRTETQGLVLLEAMAQSVPVVSIAQLGTVDILAPEKGAIIAQENIVDFSDKVIQLLTDSTYYQRIKAEAKPYAQTWRAETMATKMIDYYQTIINENLK